jgi:prepilin signal peptidase PulO-like enzyme (type II secretory pathway)
MNPYVAAYGLSVVVGALVTIAAWWLLHKLLSKVHTQPEDKLGAFGACPLWIPPTIGVVERVLYTTLVGWNVSGAAAFIGAWVTIKALGGWQAVNKGTGYGRAAFFVGLIGSALSVLFGIVGGLMIPRQ